MKSEQEIQEKLKNVKRRTIKQIAKKLEEKFEECYQYRDTGSIANMIVGARITGFIDALWWVLGVEDEN